MQYHNGLLAITNLRPKKPPAPSLPSTMIRDYLATTDHGSARLRAGLTHYTSSVARTWNFTQLRQTTGKHLLCMITRTGLALKCQGSALRCVVGEDRFTRRDGGRLLLGAPPSSIKPGFPCRPLHSAKEEVGYPHVCYGGKLFQLLPSTDVYPKTRRGSVRASLGGLCSPRGWRLHLLPIKLNETLYRNVSLVNRDSA